MDGFLEADFARDVKEEKKSKVLRNEKKERVRKTHSGQRILSKLQREKLRKRIL